MEFAYKHGDIVEIIPPQALPPDVDYSGWVSDMDEIVGQHVTIRSLAQFDVIDDGPKYYIKSGNDELDSYDFWYRECWMKPVHVTPFPKIDDIETLFGGDNQ